MTTSILNRIALACAASAFALSAIAADNMAGMNMQDAAATKEKPMAASAKTPALTNAVIKEIDAKTGMITLHHEALENMGMPAMIMAFKAGEPSMLTQFHVDDKVRVRIEPVNSKATIVTLVKQ